ncbi:hypothetical protein BDV26DRAFT_270045 [Aspergillus bertholletiae]|uniref:Transmembrane protein n=1 Tax=Aspergillus bertholletiae TaxID=1226010 RepID=A0A5N7AZD7_9EURO|nr:hypothetical protein BDV26DRAFT_270045 [Aspergillus bertholletiae]
MIDLRTDVRRTVLFLYPVCQYLRGGRFCFALRAHTRAHTNSCLGGNCLARQNGRAHRCWSSSSVFISFLFFFFFPFPSWTGTSFFSTAEKRFRGNTKTKPQAFQNPPLL